MYSFITCSLLSLSNRKSSLSSVSKAKFVNFCSFAVCFFCLEKISFHKNLVGTVDKLLLYPFERIFKHPNVYKVCYIFVFAETID